MSKRIFLLLLSTLWLHPLLEAASDYSISFEEFKKRLEGVFDEEQFVDIRHHLPPEFEIWGYDVGDFSEDGVPDLALSVKSKDLKGRTVQVFFFVNDEHGFIEATKLNVSYYEIPIEVGFTIEKGICYMTSKEKDHHWFITGYAFRKGSFLLVDRFKVGRQLIGPEGKGEIGYELYDNYLTLASRENFFHAANGKLFLGANYYTFPVYRVTRKVLPDFVTTLQDTSLKYFISGKEDWSGPADLSFSSRLARDDSALYCFITTTDDSLIIGNGDPNSTDRVELWFDLKASRMNPSSGTAPNFRLEPDGDVMSLSVSPGDFKAKRPQANLLLRREPSDLQQRGIRGISVASTKRTHGYSLQVRIPFSLFDQQKAPPTLGFTIAVHDVDIHDGAFKQTSIATSQLREWDPSTFGVLRFMPEWAVYGEVRNLAIDDLLKRLKDVGI